MDTLLRTGLRQQAVYIPDTVVNTDAVHITPAAGKLVANLAKLGFGVTEDLLHALNHTSPDYQATILETFREVMGVNANWTPLIKNWQVPANESFIDHFITFLANKFQGPGTRLQCGHIIPANTFPLERYNGCPYCGTPFEFGGLENIGQGSKVRVLDRWNDELAAKYMEDLLTSKTALDATQVESLKALMHIFPLPAVKVGMKETLIAIIDVMIEKEETEKAGKMFTTPTDILRYLWYKHTGFLQLVKPGTIIKRTEKNQRRIYPDSYPATVQAASAAAMLKLKYNRRQGLMVARWLNSLDMDATAMCEIMHPQRNMWVRFIRALRLPEFSKREGFGKLRELLDRFYRQDYTVWQAQVDHYRLRYDATNTLQLLQQRPGLFARSLFANMLWFGPEMVIAAFDNITHKVPARLLLTLQMYATYYFDKSVTRAVKPLGGVNKSIPANPQLNIYSDEQVKEMQKAVTDLCISAMKKRFAAVATTAKSIYIAPELYKIPLSIGDRSEQVQDLPGALMGTRFKVEGDKIILFMQWGKGLPAQHLDMDLSCRIAYENRTDTCSFSYLKTTGCIHSGDIRSIPHKVGTAEYIEIDIPVLAKAGAQYVTFTCNAFSQGAIAMNLVLGWMNSKHPMTVSKKGVAYDPSCVDHMVRITGGLTKGLVFGVLDVAAREIIWLEMAFDGQIVQDLSTANVRAILKKLDSKLTIGQLLAAKAEAQQLQPATEATADEVYNMQWALNTAAVTQLLID